MKIVFLDSQTMGELPNLNILEQFGNVIYYQTTSPEQTAGRVREAEIVVTNKVVLDAAVLEQAKALQLICVAATGTNNIDKEAAGALGIAVRNVVDYSTQSVAQVTFSLLLRLLNNIPYYDNYVKQGAYAESTIFTHLGNSFRELHNKQFGIIGLGNIGRQVATIAVAFGAEVVYYSSSGQNNDQPYQQLSLEELLQTSDVVSIHAPLTDKTADLINYSKLQLMKSSAILINVGRGGIVNEADLARAIDENMIGGAALDVFADEPIMADNPLIKVKNKEKLALTPHIAWSSIEARTRLMDLTAKNVQDFLDVNK